MSPKASHPVRVLVVDDERDFASALTARLRRRGLLADAAFSGLDALARLDRSTYDVVILDLKMPGMDGLAVLREVRRRDEAVRVVVLTGHGTVASGIEGMQVGAADFLQKPVDFDVLCTTIEALAAEAWRLRSGTSGGDET